MKRGQNQLYQKCCRYGPSPLTAYCAGRVNGYELAPVSSIESCDLDDSPFVLSSRSSSYVHLIPETCFLNSKSIALHNSDQCDSDDEHNVSSNTSWTSTPSVIAPLDRYECDEQRHEIIAVSLALGVRCKLARNKQRSFTRSKAPSIPSGSSLLLPLPPQQLSDTAEEKSVLGRDEERYKDLYVSTHPMTRYLEDSQPHERLAVKLRSSIAAKPSSPTHPKSTGGAKSSIRLTSSSPSSTILPPLATYPGPIIEPEPSRKRRSSNPDHDESDGSTDEVSVLINGTKYDKKTGTKISRRSRLYVKSYVDCTCLSMTLINITGRQSIEERQGCRGASIRNSYTG